MAEPCGAAHSRGVWHRVREEWRLSIFSQRPRIRIQSGHGAGWEGGVTGGHPSNTSPPPDLGWP